jgi:hypothetical protein
MAKKFDVVGTGYVPCNKKRFREARLVFFRTGWGIISVEFGNGLKVGMRRDERDEKGRLKDDFVKVSLYAGDKMCDIVHKSVDAKEFRGLGLWESSLTEFMFSRKAYPEGDLRSIVPDALKEAGLPNDSKRFFLIGKFGKFWGRPLPMGARSGL